MESPIVVAGLVTIQTGLKEDEAPGFRAEAAEAFQQAHPICHQIGYIVWFDTSPSVWFDLESATLLVRMVIQSTIRLAQAFHQFGDKKTRSV